MDNSLQSTSTFGTGNILRPVSLLEGMAKGLVPYDNCSSIIWNQKKTNKKGTKGIFSSVNPPLLFKIKENDINKCGEETNLAN